MITVYNCKKIPDTKRLFNLAEKGIKRATVLKLKPDKFRLGIRHASVTAREICHRGK